MDGGSKPMSRSLRKQLSYWIAIATIGTSVTATICSFRLALEEGREVQDGQLRQTALLVDSLGGTVSVWTELNKEILEDDPEARIFITPVDKPTDKGGSIQKQHSPQLPINISEGFQTVTMQGENWRLYVHTLQSGQRIAVGQQTTLRDEIATDSALSTLLPMLLLIPVLVILTSIIIRKALAPIIHLSRQLDQRNDLHLKPLPDADLPDEIMPFVTSINSLMQRVGDVLLQQRRFIADAAHELRSPLTALTLQAENLEHADTTQERSNRLQKLKNGLVRARSLLDQLLSLARQQSCADSAAKINMDRLVRQVLEDLMPMATAKGIDLGCKRLEEIVVTAPAEALSILMRNAVDNALRYSAVGGKVDVELYLEGGDVVFQVGDNGPGIPSGDEERLFEPFYRVMGSDEAGSGLGLAIVRSIADRLGGTVTLRNRENGRGALFCYTCRQTV
jgi:two-component system, OmpR family, sensor kinase